MARVLFSGPRPPSGFELALSQAGEGFGKGMGLGFQQHQLAQDRLGFLEALAPSPFSPEGAVQAATAMGPSALTQTDAPRVGDVAQQAQMQQDPRMRILQALQENPGVLADENAFQGLLAQMQPPEAQEVTPRTDIGRMRADLRAGLITPEEFEQQRQEFFADEPPEVVRLLDEADNQRQQGRERAAMMLERQAEQLSGKSIDRIREEAAAQAEGRMGVEQRFAPSPEAAMPDFLDDTGRVTRAASGEIRRQAGQLFGGRFDLATETMQGMNREQALSAQDIATRAERILQSGNVSGIGEAVALATREVDLPEVQTSFADLGQELIDVTERQLSPQPRPGELEGAERHLERQLDVADATGLGSSIVNFMNNTVGQIAPTVVDEDVTRGRQRLALLQGDFINAFNRNPRLPVWEQIRLSDIFSGPAVLRSPETVRKELTELDRLLSDEIDLRMRTMRSDAIPVDAKQQALEDLQSMAQFRARVRQFDVRGTAEVNQERERREQQQQETPAAPPEGILEQQPGGVRMTVPPEGEAQPTPEEPAAEETGAQFTPDRLADIDARQFTSEQARRAREELARLAREGLTPEQATEALRILDQLDGRVQ